MKRTTKAKGLSVLMAAMMTMSSFSAEAFAAEQDTADLIVSQYQQEAAYNLQEELFQVSAQFWKADKDEVSMSNGIIKSARFISGDGEMQVYLDVQKLTVSMGGNEISAYMQGLQYKSGNEENSSASEYTDAEVTARDQDGNIAQVKLVLPENTGLTDIMLDSGMMGTQGARLYLDLENAVLQDIDKSELNDQIQKASDYEEAAYTPESYTVFTEALAAAVKTAADPAAFQDEINNASQTLASAIAALVKTADKEYLLNDGLYKVTAQFWKSTEDELSMSNGIVKSCRILSENGQMKVYLDAQALSVEMGSQVITSYMQGLQYLSGDVYVDADVTARDSEGNISQVELVLAKNTILTDIKLDSGRVQPARLYLDLENAKVQNVDKSSLNAQIQSASEYTASEYTDESFQNLQTALQAAKAVAESPIAMQQEVSDQSDALMAAVNALVKKASVADGNYTIPVSVWHALAEQPSMGNDAVIKTADLTVKDGKGILKLTLLPVDLQGLKGYLGWMKKVTADGTVDAEVLSTFDVYDSFNDKENGTDPQMKGKAYPSSLSFPVDINLNEMEIQMYIPIMEGIQSGSGTQNARLRLDWTKLTPVKEEEPAVDFSALNAKINSARAINNNNGIYTKSSFDALQNAIAKAQAVAGNKNSKQADVDQALQELQNAVNGLVKESPVPAATLALDKSNITLYTKGSTTATLKATVTGSSQAVTWKSSNPAVVEVLNGKLTAKKAGTAVITATANGISKTCTVTVKAPALKLSRSKATLYINGNKTITLKAGVTGASSKVTWKSADKKIAVVKNGKVTAKKTGTVKIKATANGITKTCTITVKKQKLQIKSSSIELKKGEKVKIVAKAVPSGKITYTSNKKKVAAVTSKGVVKAKKKGTAKITVRCNGLKKTVTIKVK